MATKKIKIETENEDEDLAPQEDSISPKSSCSLWLILISLALLLLIAIGFLVFFNLRKLATPETNSPPVLNISDQISERLNSESGEEVTIKLTEQELDDLISAGDSNFPLKNASVKINPDKIVVSGKTGSSFLSLSVDVGIVPKVDAEKVKFEITEIKSLGVAAPKSVTETINSKLSSYLNNLSSSFNNVEVKEIKLYSGYMTIAGKQK
jgi:hypothetical protein